MDGDAVSWSDQPIGRGRDLALDEPVAMQPWPLRQWLPAILGACAGYMLNRLAEMPNSGHWLYLHRVGMACDAVVWLIAVNETPPTPCARLEAGRVPC